MAILNTNDLPQQTNRIIPKGTYTFSVDKFEEKTDRNNNVFLNLQASLVDHTKEGKFIIFDRFYISHNASKPAVDVGKARLRAFLESCGFRGPFDTESDPAHFRDTEFMVDVSVGKDMQGEPQNKFAKFHEKQPAKQALEKAANPKDFAAKEQPALFATQQNLDNIPF